MRKIVLIFGSIAGLICGGMFFLMMLSEDAVSMNFEYGELVGYITMVIALSSIFFAVKQYRDNHLDGTIKFGKAFLLGLYITLVASIIYVLAWELYSANFAPDFADKYVENLKIEMTKSGMSETEIETELAPQREMMVRYRDNMAFRMVITFTEIFPVGLIISLICALIFGVFMNKKPIKAMPS